MKFRIGDVVRTKNSIRIIEAGRNKIGLIIDITDISDEYTFNIYVLIENVIRYYGANDIHFDFSFSK